MTFVQLLGVSVAPSIAILIFIRWVDKYEKEPVRLLVKVFFWGAVSVIPAIIISSILDLLNIFKLFPGFLSTLIHAFIVVALSEEFSKRWFIMKFVYNKADYNEELDGIVYCVVLSLGFATVENIMYVFRYNEVIPGIWITRALLSVPAHAFFGVSMGYYLSKARFASRSPGRFMTNLNLSLIVPVLLHGIYDFALMIGNPIFVVVFIIFLFFMWFDGLKKIFQMRKKSRDDKRFS